MAKEVTAEIISIGDELLIGQTVNTNASWMGAQLSLEGIRPVHVSTIADEKAVIIEALERSKADVVLITGGLGPTQDDITKDALCTYFRTELVMNDQVLVRVEKMFQRLGRTMLEENRKQALLPASCTIIENERGTASGMWFDHKGQVFVSMPGVPYEMKAMMHNVIIPRVVEKFKPASIVHRTILTTGLGESHLADRIKDWEAGLKAHGIKLAYLPSPGIVKLRLSKYNADPSKDVALIAERVKELHSEIPELIYGEGTQTMAQVIGTKLSSIKATLATAESCTGGYLAHLITSVPGSSNYYLGSVISYANQIKRDMLGVRKDDLKEHGAVSEQVVEQMALGVMERTGATWALAISGIAGPDGGTDEKPVGTVWLAIAGPDGVEAVLIHCPGDRIAVIQRAANTALNLLRKRTLAL